jgi:DNA-binding CsgD family transcriptional regulator
MALRRRAAALLGSRDRHFRLHRPAADPRRAASAGPKLLAAKRRRGARRPGDPHPRRGAAPSAAYVDCDCPVARAPAHSAGPGPVPAAAYNVAAQLLAVEAGIDDRPAQARAHLVGGTWISVRASRLAGKAGSRSGQLAVALETMAPHERVEIDARATGLSLRQRQLVHDLARGHSTATIAHQFGIGELTVQDHLKSIFAKTGTINRYDLITRATGAAVADSRADSEG